MGRDLRRLLTRVVLYPGFQEKAKENRRAARFAAMLNLFSHPDNKTSGESHRPLINPAAGAPATHRAPLQVSQRPPAPFLLPTAVRQSARRSASPHPNAPSEPRRRGSPAGYTTRT